MGGDKVGQVDVVLKVGDAADKAKLGEGHGVGE